MGRGGATACDLIVVVVVRMCVCVCVCVGGCDILGKRFKFIGVVTR